MMNIEQLAIEHGASTWSNNEVKFIGKHISFTSSQLEAFAKALQQQSEPVAKIIHTKGTGLLEGKTITKVMLDVKYVDLPAGTALYTKPPNTVSLEQYNKLLDALIDCVMSLKGYRNELNDNQPCDAEVKGEKAIAEAERSAK